MSRFFDDIKGVVSGEIPAMQALAKRPNVPFALGVLGVSQVVSVWVSWRHAEKIRELGGSFGVDLATPPLVLTPQALVLNSLGSFAMILLVIFVLYWVSLNWFKGNAKGGAVGFFTVFCYTSILGWLSFVPVLGLLVALWCVVLSFKVMDALMGFSGWKALGVFIVTGFVFMILGVLIAQIPVVGPFLNSSF